MIPVLAFLAVAPPSDPPGVGTRITTELGVTRYSASYEAIEADAVGKTGIDGVGARLQSTLGFAVVPGFVLGPSVGAHFASTNISGGICCETFTHVLGAHAGVEASYYPSARVGFHVLGGFGVTATSLRAPVVYYDPVPGAVIPTNLVHSASGIGSYWTLGLARDWAVGQRTRIGGVIRLEAESVRGHDDDTGRLFHFRALTPSLSVTLVTGL